jgi:hypothetical protein
LLRPFDFTLLVRIIRILDIWVLQIKRCYNQKVKNLFIN